jgi:hypothetical protein
VQEPAVVQRGLRRRRESARQPLTVPGNRYVFGRIQRQYSGSVSRSFGSREYRGRASFAVADADLCVAKRLSDKPVQ